MVINTHPWTDVGWKDQAEQREVKTCLITSPANRLLCRYLSSHPSPILQRWCCWTLYWIQVSPSLWSRQALSSSPFPSFCVKPQYLETHFTPWASTPSGHSWQGLSKCFTLSFLSSITVLVFSTSAPIIVCLPVPLLSLAILEAHLKDSLITHLQISGDPTSWCR